MILEDVVDDDEATTTATTTELSPLGITSLTSTPAWVNSSSSSTSSSSAQSLCAEVSGPPELAQAGDSELARAGDSVLCVRSELHVPSGRARGDASEPAQGRDSVRLERHGLSGGDGPEPASAGATSYGGKSDWILFGVVMSSTPMWDTKPLWAVWLLWTPSMCPLVLVLGNAFFVENIFGVAVEVQRGACRVCLRCGVPGVLCLRPLLGNAAFVGVFVVVDESFWSLTSTRSCTR